MGDFALSKCHIGFASAAGALPFASNIAQLFSTLTLPIIPVVIVTIIYLTLIITAICEPLSPLKRITKEEMEDHEYERVTVEIEASDKTICCSDGCLEDRMM